MPITTPPDTYLGHRFADYGVGWPAADHADAMACRDLEERLAYGLHLLQLAHDRHAADRARIAASGAAYELPAAKYVQQLLALWIAPATDALARVAEMEAKGFAVDGAAEFRRSVVRVRHSLSVTPEQAAAVTERVAGPRGSRAQKRRMTFGASIGRELPRHLGTRSRAPVAIAGAAGVRRGGGGVG